MSEDCTHGHNSQSEESYFYKETVRLVAELRRMAGALQQAADKAPVLKIADSQTRAAA